MLHRQFQLTPARFAAPAAILVTMYCCLGCSNELAEPHTAPVLGVSTMALAPSSSTITVDFEATVTVVDDSSAVLGGGITAGDVAYGRLVYDETAPDEHPKDDIGRYRFRTNPFRLEVVINDLVFTTDRTDPDMTIKLTNDKKTSVLKDHFEVKSTNNSDVLPGVGVATIDLTLVDETATALSSDALAGQRPDRRVWNPTHTLTVLGADGWTIETEIVRLGNGSLSSRPRAKDQFQQK